MPRLLTEDGHLEKYITTHAYMLISSIHQFDNAPYIANGNKCVDSCHMATVTIIHANYITDHTNLY